MIIKIIVIWFSVSIYIVLSWIVLCYIAEFIGKILRKRKGDIK